MTKQDFLCALGKALAGLPRREVEERLAFYGESIDDRIEEGRTEAQAVADIGSVDEIAAQVIAEVPLAKIAKERVRPKRRLRAWEIVLLVLGSPVWLPLLAVAAVLGLVLYLVPWILIVSVWAVFASLVACAVGGVVAGLYFAVCGFGFTGLASVSAGICCAGLAIFLFFGCLGATRGIVRLTKQILFGIKKCFMGKENG